MGYGVSDARHRITLTEFDGSDNWVEIRTSRTSGATARIFSTCFVITGVAGDGSPSIRPAADFLSQMRVQLFRESITAWSLKANDDDEAPMPLDLHTFEQVLNDEIGNWLDATLTAYYKEQALSDAAKRRADVDAGGSDPAAGERAA